MMTPTQEQIVERVNALAAEDPFGWVRDSLIDGLDYAHARPFLAETVTAEQWHAMSAEAAQGKALRVAIDYLPFAVMKAIGHRGLSASRSVEHYRGWMYVLGIDGIDYDDDYAQYGVPVLRRISRALGQEWPPPPHPNMGDVDLAEYRGILNRMADGRPCVDDCPSGCSA